MSFAKIAALAVLGFINSSNQQLIEDIGDELKIMPDE
jgi:hypothetical protein